MLVAAGAVADEVDGFAEDLAPVLGAVAVGVLVDGAEHGGPGLGVDEEAALVGADGFATLVDDLENDAEEGGG